MTQILRTRPTRDDWLAHPPRATVRPQLRPWLLAAATLVLLNLVVDLLYAALDPRVTYDRR